MMHKKPGLLLLPNLLDEEGAAEAFLPASIFQAVPHIDGLIAESEKGGRKFLKRFTFPAPKTFRDVPIALLNEHTTGKELERLLSPLIKGECWGVVSDCGLLCLADPGAKLVQSARQLGIEMEAFVGPSAIIMALLLSGFSGQSFAFHGYLEREASKLKGQIQLLEKRAQQEKSTQIFIEAPYRNQKLLEYLLAVLQDKTRLCFACDLTMSSQEVFVKTVAAWKKATLPFLDKRPAVFLVDSP